jgi:hypothetical protein
VRVFAAVLLAALAPPAALAARISPPSPSPVPADIKQGLAEVPSIGVVDATGVALSSLPVGSAQAYRVAVKAFAWDERPTTSVQLSGWRWTVSHPITISLVRLSDAATPLGHPNIFPFPFRDGSVAWLVVIRNVLMPIYDAHYWGPFAGAVTESLVVFVSTEKPRWGFAMTLF